MAFWPLCAVPATFMSAVSCTYILMAQEGFGLPQQIAYPIGALFALGLRRPIRGGGGPQKAGAGLIRREESLNYDEKSVVLSVPYGFSADRRGQRFPDNPIPSCGQAGGLRHADGFLGDLPACGPTPPPKTAQSLGMEYQAAFCGGSDQVWRDTITSYAPTGL